MHEITPLSFNPETFSSHPVRVFTSRRSLGVGGRDNIVDFKQKEEIAKETPSINPLQNDIEQVHAMEREFHEIFAEELNPDGTKKMLSFNPVHSRWKFEKLETPEKREKFNVDEEFNLQTALRERYGVATSEFKYSIDTQGKLRSHFMPDEPFENVIRRGIANRKKDSSSEIEREEAELEGILDLQNAISNPETPVGTRFGFISGTGQKEFTPYVDNFVDIHEVCEDTKGKRFVNTVRFKSGSSYEEYKKIVLQCDPTYFEGEEGVPQDVVHARKKLTFSKDTYSSSDDIIDRLFKRNSNVMKEHEFQWIWRQLQPNHAQEYLRSVSAGERNWQHIGEAVHVLYAAGDELEREVMAKRLLKGTIHFELPDETIFIDMVHERQRLKNTLVESRGVGCGSSSGFKMKSALENFIESTDPVKQLMKNSVGQFGSESSQDYKNDPNLCRCGGKEAHFHCPHKDAKGKDCKREIVVGKGIEKCPGCGNGKTC